jgi:hypothetical protein
MEEVLLYQACGLAVLPRKKSHPWLEWLFKCWKISGFLCVCVPTFYLTIQHSGLTAIPDPHYSCAHTPSPPHPFFWVLAMVSQPNLLQQRVLNCTASKISPFGLDALHEQINYEELKNMIFRQI